MVIGYGKGTTGERRRPIFITSPDEVERLVLDEACITNLSGYLVSEGLLSDEKRVAVFLRPEGVRAVNILAAESQLDSDQLVIFGFDVVGNEIKALKGIHVEEFADVIESLKESAPGVAKELLLEKIESMSPQERFSYWQGEFAKCIKCYACRQACPMCYCRRCIVDSNQPQWVNTSSHSLGNFEWNIVRAFHLSGRCVECGNCDRACPVNIPLRLINHRMAEEVLGTFDHFAGTSKTQEPVLASFKKDDSETFIL